VLALAVAWAALCDPPFPVEEATRIVTDLAAKDAKKGAAKREARRAARETATAPTVPPVPPRAPVGGDLGLGGPEGLTDMANGRRLVRRYGRSLRWCGTWDKYLVWDGKRWQRDDRCRAEALAKRSAKLRWRELAALQHLRAKDQQLVLAFVRSSCGRAGVANALVMARSESGVPVTVDQLDQGAWLLNCQNGTVDLQSGELREHRREDLLTKVCPVRYDPHAKCPLWKSFLRRVLDGNEALLGYVRRVCGYCLTGDVGEQCLWVLYGKGRNGKSTFLRTLLALLGEYGCPAPPGLLVAKKHEPHPTGLATLFGRRLVTTIEVQEGGRLDEAFLKELTGGDPLPARRMREDFWEFLPTHKLFIAANHKPRVKGTDLAIWRRLKLVPFTVTIPDDECDPGLGDKLTAELPGILAWSVGGCLEWQQQDLREPPEVTEATAVYRSEQDTVGQFLAERCERREGAKTQAAALLAAYSEWSGDKFITRNAFTDRLRAHGLESKRTKSGVCWLDIVLLPEEGTTTVRPTAVTVVGV
jgi:putative DNA primase/helicase